MICIEYFFPKHPANNGSLEARLLRRGLLPIVFLHVLIACLGMAFVSISTFIAQFFYIALLYSVYMTLRSWIIWVYMVIVGFNVLSGVFSVFLYEGSAFVVYLIILIVYSLMIVKVKMDSEAWRNLSVNNGGANYLEPGIRHMLNTAREEYGRNILPGQGGNEPDHNRRNTEALDNEEPLLQNHYLN